MNRFFSGALASALLLFAGRIFISSASALETPAKTGTMLEMTFPEFEAAVKRTDVLLLPIGAIEEHGASLPLSSDAITSAGQCNEVQRVLRGRGVETIVGPPLNIGLTNETGDFGRSGTYGYPGSLTVRADTFVGLYVDVLRSLRDKGLRRVFLFSGHSGGAQQKAVARIAEEATRTIDGMSAYALLPSENIERAGVTSGPSLIPLENFRNFERLGQLLGNGTEPPKTTHADGVEISLMLLYRPDMVRRGFEKLPQSPSSRFFAAVASGDRADNPSGMGGFPSAKASAAVGRAILEYRTPLMADAIARVLGTGIARPR